MIESVQSPGDERDARFWWVNQRQTFEEERAAGILWAPQRSRSGQSRPFWTAMTSVRPSDLVFHYARGVRALSRATTSGYLAERPAELPPDIWEVAGWEVKANYFDLQTRVELSEIPRAWRLQESRQGPFDNRGEVKVGYLYPLSAEFAQQPLGMFGERWPQAALSYAGPIPDEAQHGAARLLRRLIGEDLETLTGRRNRILSVSTSDAIVQTERSRDGQPVPIADVDAALDLLRRDGSVTIHPT